MIEILVSIATGIAVCIFGMWCFIRGQQNGMQIRANEIPTQINNPVIAVAEVVKEIKSINNEVKSEDINYSLQEQLFNAIRAGNEE